MYFAENSDTGQIVVPMEIRKLLKLKAGDNILFQLTQDGEVIISNACASAVSKAQASMSGIAGLLGIQDEADVQTLVDGIRYGKKSK